MRLLESEWNEENEMDNVGGGKVKWRGLVKSMGPPAWVDSEK